eukprot:4728594-Pyramimonas_sp.AAC.1
MPSSSTKATWKRGMCFFTFAAFGFWSVCQHAMMSPSLRRVPITWAATGGSSGQHGEEVHGDGAATHIGKGGQMSTKR